MKLSKLGCLMLDMKWMVADSEANLSLIQFKCAPSWANNFICISESFTISKFYIQINKFNLKLNN